MTVLENQPPVVLVADDDGDTREMVATVFRAAGYEVLTASDGQEAVDLALERKPDLAVLDVMMPKLDGYEATRLIRRTEVVSRMPVIILTARTEGSDVAQGFEAGTDYYVKKPFTPDELLTRAGEVLAARRSR
jgi:DNA-binding response OmpR family regulator